MHSEKRQSRSDAPNPQNPLVVSSDSSSETICHDEEEDTFPEGGLEAWSVVFGSFCAMLSVFGIINSAAVFESYFSSNQLKEYDPSTIGWIFSVYLFIVFFAGMQAGPIFDRHGPRALVAAGSLLVIASQMLLGLCTSKSRLYEPCLCVANPDFQVTTRSC